MIYGTKNTVSIQTILNAERIRFITKLKNTVVLSNTEYDLKQLLYFTGDYLGSKTDHESD